MRRKKTGAFALLFFLLGVLVWLFAGACRFSALGFFGVAGVLLVYWLLGFLKSGHPKGAKILQILFSVFLVLLLLAMTVTLGFVLHDSQGTEEPECEYLLVLGAGVDGNVPSLSLSERLRAALLYLNTYPEAKCIVSGGQGSGEQMTEAQCMYDWLTDRGIAPERILLEERASSTAENLKFSLELLEARGEGPKRLAIVSSEYHLFRAGLMAKKAGVEPLLVPARTGLVYLRLNYYFREIFGVWAFLVFGG